MILEQVLLVTAKIIVLLLGTAITTIALLAHRRSKERLMLYLGFGFGLLAFGSFVEGVMFELLRSDLLTAHMVESIFVLAGLVTIAALLRPRRMGA